MCPDIRPPGNLRGKRHGYRIREDKLAGYAGKHETRLWTATSISNVYPMNLHASQSISAMDSLFLAKSQGIPKCHARTKHAEEQLRESGVLLT